MAKKNYDKKVAKKEVNDVLDKAIISDSKTNEIIETVDDTVEEMESLLEESLEIDMDKLSEELEQMKKEIFEEEPKKVEEVKKENKNKTFVNRVFGLMWNGQEYDY